MLLSTLLISILGPALGVQAVGQTGGNCLPSGSEEPINEAFRSGGQGHTVKLCPGSAHRLKAPITLTARGQTLTTEGNPLGLDRAILVVEGENQSTAILGDCNDCSDITIRSLVVDGNRPQLLRIAKSPALVAIGNAHGQTVRDCKIYEPRGWSALHIREGNDRQCTKASILNNEVGPCGEEWDDEYDGEDENNPKWGGPRADGISLACKESLIKSNVVYDATDGAIVIFGAAGTTVEDNDVYSRTRLILGGINLVDYDPFSGDYTGTVVKGNRIHALGRHMKTGIVIGPAAWSDDTDQIVYGGTVQDNTLYGGHFGYGIVVSSARDFTVLDNLVAPGAAFGGSKGKRCPSAPENGKPTALLIHKASASGVFQDDFVNGQVQHIICIDPQPEDGVPYKPWRFRDSPEAIAAAAADTTVVPEDYDNRIAEAVMMYQLSVTQALDKIKADLRGGTVSVGSGHEGVHGADVSQLVLQLESLKAGDATLRRTVQGIADQFIAVSQSWRSSLEARQPLLESLAEILQTSSASPSKKRGPLSRLLGVGGSSSASSGQIDLAHLLGPASESRRLSAFWIIACLIGVFAMGVAARRISTALGRSFRKQHRL